MVISFEGLVQMRTSNMLNCMENSLAFHLCYVVLAPGSPPVYFVRCQILDMIEVVRMRMFIFDLETSGLIISGKRSSKLNTYRIEQMIGYTNQQELGV